MRDFPPDSLITRLIAMELCTAADVQRASGRVRRMTRDLPAFDSVWIDALTQRGVLTPFQGRWIELFPPETLRAGDYVLLDGLGAGAESETFLAQGPDRRPVVIKRIKTPVEQAVAVEMRLGQLLERGRTIQSPHLSVASGSIKTSEGLYLVGPYIPGLNLSELLVRRGRFPAPVVSAVAEQLLSALSVLHAAGLAHGDVRLIKLRLTDRGQIILVDSGLKPALTPELLVHAVDSAAEADVIAPERIGTNQPATAASDLYSSGCVLWQLLTGRPPHPQADPLTKLAAHQTRRIGDVRELAPETPPRLADLIHLLTSPNPQDRPHSAEAARRRLGTRHGMRSGELARFRRQFDATVPHLATRSAPGTSRWQGLSAATLILGLAIVAMSDRGLRTELLDIAQRTWSRTAPESPDAAPQEPRLDKKIPQPDAQGVITLTEDGLYAPRDLTAAGPLTLQAAAGVRPVILIASDKPLRIAAQQITLKNIDVQWNGEPLPSENQAMIELRSQRFLISGCGLNGPGASKPGSPVSPADKPVPPEENSPPALSFISWEPLDRRDPQAGVLHLEYTSLTGVLHGLRCLAAPQQIVWRNVLKTQAGSAVVIEQAQTPRGVKLVMDHVTLRNSGPLLTCTGPLTERAAAAGIDIEAADSVFDAASPWPLVELQGPKVREDWPQAIRLLGDGCVVPPNAVLLAAVDPDDGVRSVLESDELQFEGLFLDDFRFAGPLTDNPRDSVVVKSQAPRRQADQMPGIDASRLPARDQ